MTRENIPEPDYSKAGFGKPQCEPEPQETIAKWIKANTEHREWYICPKCSHQTPRFKDEWQGLTDEEIKEIVGLWGDQPVKGYTRKLFDQIESKLREKNI